MSRHQSIYDKRIALIKSGKKHPSTKELQEAYGYLDYCYCCGQPITLWDRLFFNTEHSMFGNSHRYKCKDGTEVKR